MPTHLAAHIVQTVYAIAEKAAVMIQEDWETKPKSGGKAAQEHVEL